MSKPVVSAAQAIVSAGYRKLALEQHPDKSGGKEQMTALNLAADALRRLRRATA